jgi:flagellar biosynthesis protein FliR
MYSRETCLTYVFPYFSNQNISGNVKWLLSKLSMLVASLLYRLHAVEDTGVL